MRKFIQNKLKEQKGLTLIELLAVIVILAIIAAIAVPAIGNIIENSRIDAAKSDALNVLNAAGLYEAQEGEIPAGGIPIGDLETKGFLEDTGSLATGNVYPGPALYATTDVLVDGSTITIGVDTLAGAFPKSKITGAESTTTTRKGMEDLATPGAYALK